MGVGWNPDRFKLSLFLVLTVCLQTSPSWSLNSEGLVLLDFRLRLNSDPHGTLSNWDADDNDPCSWFGVFCVEGKVETLDLSGLPVGQLSHMKSLDLSGNKFEGVISQELGTLNMLSETKIDETTCVNRKFGNFKWEESLNESDKTKSIITPIKGALTRYLYAVPHLLLPRFKSKDSENIGADDSCENFPCSPEPHTIQNLQNIFNLSRRRLQQQQSNNLAAVTPTGGTPFFPIIPLATSHSSGTFPAIGDPIKKQNDDKSPADSPSIAQSSPTGSFQIEPLSHDDDTVRNLWNQFYIIPIALVLSILVAVIFLMFRKRAMKTIGPWKTGLSGQLQKAFVTGVPKLNRSELETACEDFSNIIQTFDGCTIYKGTLSSGVEIAVASAVVTSIKEWSKSLEKTYRKKIDMLSRINHKNFVNLIGYCEEDAPFSRMMVFEYAPNGTLFEHLHVEGMEHLDWNARTRIIMGAAYCLQHLHHDLNPPIAHSHVNSNCVYLTDDYAAKLAEICFVQQSSSKASSSSEDEGEHSELPPISDPETNVYNFGILLLEIISGKLQYSEEQGRLVRWASEYLNDKKYHSYMIDPSLKSFKNNELDVICEVIQLCIHQDPRHRPTMKEITSKLRYVINISPEQATPRLSPLWWAELEILSAEAT